MCAPATAREPIGGQSVSPGVSAMELRTATNTGGSRPRPYADSVRASCLCLFGLLVGLTNCLSNGRPSRLLRDVASCRILLNDRDHRHSTLVPRSDHVYPPSFPSLSHSYHHLHHDPDHHQARTVPSEDADTTATHILRLANRLHTLFAPRYPRPWIAHRGRPRQDYARVWFMLHKRISLTQSECSCAHCRN